MDCEWEVITSDNSWGFSTRRNCQSSSKELLSPPAGRAVSSPADPVSLAVSPCIHLGAQSVSGRGKKKKKYLCKKYLRWLPRKLFLFTGNGQLFVSSESYFGWLLQVWDAATGSRIEEVSELYPFPKITSFHVSLLRTALSISTGFSPWWVVRGLLPLTCKGCKFQVIYSLPDIWLTGEGWEQGSITLTCKTVSLFLGAFGYRSEDKLLGVSHTQPCKTWSGFVREDTESPYFWSPWALSWQACMEQETKHGLLLELGFPQ